MAYNQIYGIVNSGKNQAIGKTGVTAVDTTTLADVGGQILSSGATIAAFYNGLMGAIFETRSKAKSYGGASRVSSYRNPSDFALYRRKIQCTSIQDFNENTSYKAQDVDAYDGDLANNWTDILFGVIGGFETKPIIRQDKRLARCFKDEGEMAAFITMLDTWQLNEVKCGIETTEMLARATAMASCFAGANTVVDLGYLYNQATGKAISPATWQHDADFIRFAIVEMKRIIGRFKSMNRVYNNYSGADRFTNDEDLVIDIHENFVASMDGYLNNSLIEKFIKLPGFNPVSRWQATGTTKDFGDAEKFTITNDNLNADGTTWSSYVSNSGKTVTATGVIAFAHDIDKFANTVYDLRTVTGRNELQETSTIVTKFDTGWAVDPSEQGVVFLVGTYSAA